MCLCGARVTVQLTLNERGCCVPNCNWPLIRLLMPASSYMNNAVWHSAPSSARKEYLESLARVRAPAIGVPQYHTRTRPHIPSKAKKATRVDTEANVALPALTQIGELFDRRIVGGGVGQVYAKRAEETYLKALALATPRNAPAAADPPSPRSRGPRGLRNAIEHVVEERRSKNWERVFARWSHCHGVGREEQRWAELRQRLNAYNREALIAESGCSIATPSQPTPQRARIGVRLRESARAAKVQGLSYKTETSTMRAQLQEQKELAHRARVNPAWGGTGYRYSVVDGEGAKLQHDHEEVRQQVTNLYWPPASSFPHPPFPLSPPTLDLTWLDLAFHCLDGALPWLECGLTLTICP